MTSQELKITGMHCVDCAHQVEAALKSVPGVQDAHVVYLKRQARVIGVDLVPDQLIAAVRGAGYDATAP